MTGREFCNLLEIDYISIIDKRKNDAEYNLNYFIRELLKIEEVKNKIIQLIDSVDR